MRFAGAVPKNRSTRGPASILCFDAETMPHETAEGPHVVAHRLRLGIARAGRLVKGQLTRTASLVYRHEAELFTFARRYMNKRRPLWIFAHNLGFDWAVSGCYRWLEDGRMTLGGCVLEDPPTIIWGKVDGCRVVLCDTYNFFPSPLAELGDELGCPKMHMPEFSDPDRDWMLYCRRDVDIVERVVVSLLTFLRDNDLGVFRWTTAAQALQTYRHKFMSTPWHVHNIQRALTLEREAHYGAEFSAFYVGHVSPFVDVLTHQSGCAVPAESPWTQGPVHALDVSSLYPYVMREHRYPYKLVGWTHALGIPQLRELVKQYAVIADVRVVSERPIYPVAVRLGLGLGQEEPQLGRWLDRRRRLAETWYPVGDYWTTLTTPDLIEALDHDEIGQVQEVAWYLTEDLFSGFVDWFWALRKRCLQSGNPVWAKYAKMLMNGLYGKLGQRSKKWVTLPSVEALCYWGYWAQADPETGQMAWWRGIAGTPQVQRDAGEAAFSSPAIAAHITAYARQHMRMLRGLCPPRSVYAQLADCLHVSPEALDVLTTAGWAADNELGRLRLVATWDRVHYRGPCDMTADGVPHVAGLSRRAQPIGEGLYRVEQWERLRSQLHRGPDGAVKVQTVEVYAPCRAPQGPVSASGWTEPPRLELGSR